MSGAHAGRPARASPLQRPRRRRQRASHNCTLRLVRPARGSALGALQWAPTCEPTARTAGVPRVGREGEPGTGGDEEEGEPARGKEMEAERPRNTAQSGQRQAEGAGADEFTCAGEGTRTPRTRRSVRGAGPAGVQLARASRGAAGAGASGRAAAPGPRLCITAQGTMGARQRKGLSPWPSLGSFYFFSFLACPRICHFLCWLRQFDRSVGAGVSLHLRRVPGTGGLLLVELPRETTCRLPGRGVAPPQARR